MSDTAQHAAVPGVLSTVKTTLQPTYQPPSPPPVPASDAVTTAIPVVAPDDTPQPVPTVGTAKEKFEPLVTLERPSVDQSGGVQMVELERTPELPPEVESYLQKVEQQHDQLPQEIVIADEQGVQPTTRYLAQPVVVLPITPQVEEVGKKANPQKSVRWLVEWCWKMMKVFSGKIIYRHDEPKS